MGLKPFGRRAVGGRFAAAALSAAALFAAARASGRRAGPRHGIDANEVVDGLFRRAAVPELERHHVPAVACDVERRARPAGRGVEIQIVREIAVEQHVHAGIVRNGRHPAPRERTGAVERHRKPARLLADERAAAGRSGRVRRLVQLREPSRAAVRRPLQLRRVERAAERERRPAHVVEKRRVVVRRRAGALFVGPAHHVRAVAKRNRLGSPVRRAREREARARRAVRRLVNVETRVVAAVARNPPVERKHARERQRERHLGSAAGRRFVAAERKTVRARIVRREVPAASGREPRADAGPRAIRRARRRGFFDRKRTHLQRHRARAVRRDGDRPRRVVHRRAVRVSEKRPLVRQRLRRERERRPGTVLQEPARRLARRRVALHGKRRPNVRLAPQPRERRILRYRERHIRPRPAHRDAPRAEPAGACVADAQKFVIWSWACHKSIHRGVCQIQVFA